jgi:hypothetical protein
MHLVILYDVERNGDSLHDANWDFRVTISNYGVDNVSLHTTRPEASNSESALFDTKRVCSMICRPLLPDLPCFFVTWELLKGAKDHKKHSHEKFTMIDAYRVWTPHKKGIPFPRFAAPCSFECWEAISIHSFKKNRQAFKSSR